MMHIRENYMNEIVMTMNPAGYWPADDGDGFVLKDRSANKNHGRLHNVGWEEGLLDFRGLFQWIEVPPCPGYEVRQFSLGCWVFLRSRVRGSFNPTLNRGAGMTLFGNGYHTSSYTLDTLNEDEVLFGKSRWRVNGGSPLGASLCIRRGERIDILSGGSEDALGTENKEGLVAIGEWQHLLYTFESPAKIEGGKEWVGLQDTLSFDNAGMAKLFVNGKLAASSNRVEFRPRSAPFLIGSDANWWLQAVTSGSLDGSLRDLVFFDRALGDNEAAFLYGETHPGVRPLTYGDNVLFMNERAPGIDGLTGLPRKNSWEMLRQLSHFDDNALGAFKPWLKTRKEAIAVKLLLRLGETETVHRLVPEYLETIRDETLSEEVRADALLAVAECRGLVSCSELDTLLSKFNTEPERLLNIEDYYRNALINAFYELDPENKIPESLLKKQSGRLFSQGDELRDLRPEVDNLRAYTPSAIYGGAIYRCGTGVAWEAVESVPGDEFEGIAKELEEEYPSIRRWAEGKNLARLTISRIDSQGVETKYYPLGAKFIFDQTDAKLRGWSIAFDKEGYAHLTGGMHNAPVEDNFMPGSWESWGLSRELRSDAYPSILYWVSKDAGRIDSFEFVGHRSNARNIPLALGMNYMNFVQDRHRELFLYGRIYVQGMQSWGMYRYDTAARAWTALGGFAPDVKIEFPLWADRFISMAADWLALAAIRWKNDHPKSKVLAWSRQPHFYNFIRGWAVRWDKNNRMHFQAPLFGMDQNNRNANIPLYAYSDDNGRSFHSADGTKLGLPFSGDPGRGNASLLSERNRKRYNLWVSLMKKCGYDTGLQGVGIVDEKRDPSYEGFTVAER